MLSSTLFNLPLVGFVGGIASPPAVCFGKSVAELVLPRPLFDYSSCLYLKDNVKISHHSVDGAVMSYITHQAFRHFVYSCLPEVHKPRVGNHILYCRDVKLFIVLQSALSVAVTKIIDWARNT